MATSQQFLVCDSSTLANFKNWAQAISGFFTTAGWTQSADTGQVNWSTIVSVPGTNAYVYEIWQPNDGLTTFYLKVEYGNTTTGTNSPTVRLTLSTGTNGSGTPNGFVVGPFSPANAGAGGTPASSTATYECNFYGTSSSIAVMMWRSGSTGSSGLPFIFAVERSLNSSGSATSAYSTLCVIGQTSTSSVGYNQQSVVFGVGLAPKQVRPSVRGSQSSAAGAFNGSLPMDLVSPYVGFWDQNMTTLGSASSGDFTEGVTFTATVYGSSMTFMPSAITTAFNSYGPGLTANACVTFVRTA